MERRPIKPTLARVEAVRNAVGEGVDLMLDAHGRLDSATASILASELEPYDLLFLEEPVPPDSLGALQRVAEKSKVPIAAGERSYTKFGFWVLIQSRLWMSSNLIYAMQVELPNARKLPLSLNATTFQSHLTTLIAH